MRKGEFRLNGAAVAVKRLDPKFFIEGFFFFFFSPINLILFSASLAWPPREVEVMRRLHHPNIVELYDVVRLPDCWHVVTELATGGEVRTRDETVRFLN